MACEWNVIINIWLQNFEILCIFISFISWELNKNQNCLKRLTKLKWSGKKFFFSQKSTRDHNLFHEYMSNDIRNLSNDFVVWFIFLNCSSVCLYLQVRFRSNFDEWRMRNKAEYLYDAVQYAQLHTLSIVFIALNTPPTVRTIHRIGIRQSSALRVQGWKCDHHK